MLDPPQAHPLQSDLVFLFRKECFYFPALALRCRETGVAARSRVRLSCRFVEMDRILPIR